MVPTITSVSPDQLRSWAPKHPMKDSGYVARRDSARSKYYQNGHLATRPELKQQLEATLNMPIPPEVRREWIEASKPILADLYTDEKTPQVVKDILDSVAGAPFIRQDIDPIIQ